MTELDQLQHATQALSAPSALLVLLLCGSCEHRDSGACDQGDGLSALREQGRAVLGRASKPFRCIADAATCRLSRARITPYPLDWSRGQSPPAGHGSAHDETSPNAVAAEGISVRYGGTALGEELSALSRGSETFVDVGTENRDSQTGSEGCPKAGAPRLSSQASLSTGLTAMPDLESSKARSMSASS